MILPLALLLALAQGAGAYRLEVGIVTAVASHAPPVPRFSGLQLRVLDPDGKPVTRFVPVHGHALHLFVVGRNLQYFRHVHPEDLGAGGGPFDGMFQIDLRDLPGLQPGQYVAIADVLPDGGTPQMLHSAFVTPGFTGPPAVAPRALAPGPAQAVVNGVRVRIATDLRARQPGTIRLTFADAATGGPPAGLEPFLGAAAHLLIVNPDLTRSIHLHPDTGAGRATVTFDLVMPAEGVYKLWVQFQRQGQVGTGAFVIRVD